MKYLLLIYNNPAHQAADPEALLSGHATLFRELADAGTVVSSASLTEPRAATTVHVRDGSVPAVTDGPFLESKEYLAGYYLVDCDSREQAIEIATRIPCAADGAVEIRPVNEDVTALVQGETG